MFDMMASRGKRHQGKLKQVIARLEIPSASELEWLGDLLTAALKPKLP
jgi:hypothetical protein